MKARAILITSVVATMLALSIAGSAIATPIDQIPNPRLQNGWVADTANVLTPSQASELNRAIDQLKATTGDEIGIVTVADAQPFGSCKELTTQLFHTWKLGIKGKDNGLLTVLCLKERRVEQETGYGLEATLPDSLLHQIQQQRMVPQFKQQQFGAGLVAGNAAVVDLLLGKTVAPAAQAGWGAEQWIVLAIVIVVVLVILLILWVSSDSGGGGGSSSWSSSSSSSDSSSSGGSWGGGDSGGGGSGSGW